MSSYWAPPITKELPKQLPLFYPRTVDFTGQRTERDGYVVCEFVGPATFLREDAEGAHYAVLAIVAGITLAFVEVRLTFLREHLKPAPVLAGEAL